MKGKDSVPNRTAWIDPYRERTKRTMRPFGTWKMAVGAALLAVLMVLAGTFFWARMHRTFDPAYNSAKVGQYR